MKYEHIKHTCLHVLHTSEETALETKFKEIVLRKITKYIMCLNIHVNTYKLSKNNDILN